MGGLFTTYNLGKLGVVVDKTPIHTEDGELLQAQNAIRDPLGSDGGLRKRPGLTALNGSAAAGSISGFQDVPLAKPTTRRLILGRWVDATDTGWNTSTDAFTTHVTTGGPDGFTATAVPRAPQKVWDGIADFDARQRGVFSGNPGVIYRNRFYYAGNDYTQGTDPPNVHVWDGTTDRILCHMPPATGTTPSRAIISLIVGGGYLYALTHESGTSTATNAVTRVFQIDTETGQVTQIGEPDDQIPAARWGFGLGWYLGRLWLGRTSRVSSDGTNPDLLYFRPDTDSVWTGENGPSTLFATPYMTVYRGLLFLSTVGDSSVGARVHTRDPVGTFAVSKQAALNEGGGSPIITGFGEWNSFNAAAVFEGNLYVTYFNQVGSGDTGDRHVRVYKYDGSSWTLVYSPAANGTDATPYTAALVHNGVLYFVSAPGYNVDGSEENTVLSTTDGASWTVYDSLDNLSVGTIGLIVT